MKKIITYILIGVLFINYSCEKKVENGYDVIRLMKSKYNNSWYKNFTFSQYVNKYENDSVVSKAIWHEAYSYPNKLIIKFDSLNGGNGIIFIHDSFYIFNDNKITSKQKRIHDLILLGFDVYEQPVEITFFKLKELGYDLSKICETKIDNRATYCIGATNEKDSLNKFYIDKENLYFIKNNKYQDDNYTETIFSNYVNIDGNLVATKIFFYKDNHLIMDEEYFNIQFPESLDQQIFNPANFENAIW